MDFIQPIEILIEQIRRLPGIGKKSATRMAFGILEMDFEAANELAGAIMRAKEEVKSCKVCGNYCDGEICPICSDDRRDSSVICVVEDVRALMSLVRVEGYSGLYHVLGGTLSPIDGRGPDDIAIAPLLDRIKSGGVTEVIVATNPTIDGETTAMYISKLLKPLGVKTTRLAYGIPVGGDLDYADEMTLFRAMDGRKEL